MEILIRPFRAQDWDGVFLLDQTCFVPPYRLEYPRLRALVEDPTIAVLVVEAREDPAANPATAEAALSDPSSTDQRSAAQTGADAQPAEAGLAEPQPAGSPLAPPAGDESAAEPGQDDPHAAVVGGLFLKHDTQAARMVILSIMVDPGFRRVGLARRLVGWAERVARGRHLTELVAPLEAENGDGAAFLEAMGFIRDPGVPPFFADPAGGDVWRKAVAGETPPGAEAGPQLPAEPPAEESR